jgi:hypothetical protein
MATVQDELYRTFLMVSGEQASVLSDATATLANLLAQTKDAETVRGTVTVQTAANAPMSLAEVLAQVHEAVVPQGASAPAAPASTTRDTNSSGGGLSSVASTVLKSGFGLAPLVSGLISLFGGGEQEAPAPLVKYALPAAVDFQAAQTAAGMSGIDYDQSGAPRAYRAGSEYGTASGGEKARQASQITVNVQAMDARSFMDRSNDIALAVRDAMLNMNAINDVVNEL